MWSQTYGNGKECSPSLVETSDGGFAIAGTTGSLGAGSDDFWLVKTYANGNMEWNQTYGGAESERAQKVIVTSDGGFALAGITHSFGAGLYDFWLVKTDSYGNMEWNQTYGGSGSDFVGSLIETSDGGYALAGVTSGGIGNQSYIDAWMVKTDADGNKIWNQTYGGRGDQYIFSLVETSDGTFALAGFKISTYTGSIDLWLIKTDKYGYIPEFPSWTPTLFMLTIVAVVIYKRKLPKTPNPQSY